MYRTCVQQKSRRNWRWQLPDGFLMLRMLRDMIIAPLCVLYNSIDSWLRRLRRRYMTQLFVRERFLHNILRRLSFTTWQSIRPQGNTNLYVLWTRYIVVCSCVCFVWWQRHQLFIARIRGAHCCYIVQQWLTFFRSINNTKRCAHKIGTLIMSPFVRCAPTYIYCAFAQKQCASTESCLALCVCSHLELLGACASAAYMRKLYTIQSDPRIYTEYIPELTTIVFMLHTFWFRCTQMDDVLVHSI